MQYAIRSEGENAKYQLLILLWGKYLMSIRWAYGRSSSSNERMIGFLSKYDMRTKKPNICKAFSLHMENITSTDMMPEQENFAICTFILQNYAGLTFAEATTYLWAFEFNWGMDNTGRSRQAIYSLKKKAMKKIESCNVPVLEMIKPYVERTPFIWVD